MPHQSVYKVIGVMSGSSLDGVDVAYCTFTFENDNWQFSIEHADCIPYSEGWADKLRSARTLDGRSLWKLHAEYGHYLGGIISAFISKYDLNSKTNLISSHGHTIFHYPDEGFTTQIGDGASIAVKTGVPVVCDLRSSDVALGGNGAPIVPIGELQLFTDYDHFLNLGGIANLTVNDEGAVFAFDICAANQVLNHYAAQKGMIYDKDGEMASSGTLNQQLLDVLDAIEYYKKPYPKSLDNGFSTGGVLPILDRFDIDVADKIHTYCEHIARQIAAHIRKVHYGGSKNKLLVTGGGALNKYLISRIHAHCTLQVIVPDENTINYKEALVMAFIGVLRLRGESNVIASVTGASRDSVGGALYYP